MGVVLVQMGLANEGILVDVLLYFFALDKELFSVLFEEDDDLDIRMSIDMRFYLLGNGYLSSGLA